MTSKFKLLPKQQLIKWSVSRSQPMSDVKRLILGISLVAVGLALVLSADSILPWLGGLLGIYGSYLTIKVILTGHLH
jgi:hypothetical protein